MTVTLKDHWITLVTLSLVSVRVNKTIRACSVTHVCMVSMVSQTADCVCVLLREQNLVAVVHRECVAVPSLMGSVNVR